MVQRYAYSQILQVGTAVSFGLVFFLIPTNLFLTLCQSCGYSHGLLSDYLIPKFYLQDIAVGVVIFLALVGAFFEQIFELRIRVQKQISISEHSSFSFLASTATMSVSAKILIGLWLVLLAVQLFSNLPVLGAIYWLRLSMYTLFAVLFLVHANKHNYYKQLLLRASQLGLLFQAGIAVFQWHTQQSLAGYWLLGEPTLSTYSGITKIAIDGVQFILPYGTTPHPNILGGYASIVLLMSVFCLMNTNSKLATNEAVKKILHTVFTSLSSSAIVAGLYVIFLTQSAPASLALILAGICWGLQNVPFFKTLKKQKILSKSSILFFFCLLWGLAGIATWQVGLQHIDQPSLFRRSYLLESSYTLFKENAIFGVGLGQFTNVASQELRPFETSRFNQPVHHNIMLWTTEAGITGIFILMSGLWVLRKWISKNQQKDTTSTSLFSILLILTPLLVWDHYLISLPQGQLLFLIWILNFSKESLYHLDESSNKI